MICHHAASRVARCALLVGILAAASPTSSEQAAVLRLTTTYPTPLADIRVTVTSIDGRAVDPAAVAVPLVPGRRSVVLEQSIGPSHLIPGAPGGHISSHTLAFEARPGRTYRPEGRPQIGGAHLVWIEEVETGTVVAGTRPAAEIQGFRVQELRRAIHQKYVRPGATAAALGNHTEAERLYRLAFAETERQLGSAEASLGSLGFVAADAALAQGRHAEAATLVRQALPIYRRLLREDAAPQVLAVRDLEQRTPDDPVYRQRVRLFAIAYLFAGRSAEAQLEVKRELDTAEDRAGATNDPVVALWLDALADRYVAQGWVRQAEPDARRALGILEKVWGAQHPLLAGPMSTLQTALAALGRHAEAESLARRLIALVDSVLGDHPALASSVEHHAAILGKLGREQEAAQAESRAKAIRARLPQ